MNKERRVLIEIVLGIIIVVCAIIFMNKTIEKRKIEKRRAEIAEKENVDVSETNELNIIEIQKMLNSNIVKDSGIPINEVEPVYIMDEEAGTLVESDKEIMQSEGQKNQ